METKITIKVYYTQPFKENTKVVIDEESMRSEFNKKLKVLVKKYGLQN